MKCIYKHPNITSSRRHIFLDIDTITSDEERQNFITRCISILADELMKYIEALEASLGIEAEKEFLPLQLGDVPDTYADVKDLVKNFNYKPQMNINQGVDNFVKWYKGYYID